MFNFGKRKIQKSNYSYWVTLPLNWLQNNRLERGDEIELDMSETGELILKPIKSIVPVPGTNHETGTASARHEAPA